jgi:ribosomal protein S18 acetylase RimI-like enzyme
MLKILPVSKRGDMAAIRELLQAYADALEFNLDFQGFEQELENLPGEYAPPEGVLLLACWQNEPAGCVALRKLSNRTCEMKRLYVKPELRNLGIGQTIVEHIIREARCLGYARMRLDTVPSMARARALYTKLGFKSIAPYRFNPIEGAVFMELQLSTEELSNGN